MFAFQKIMKINLLKVKTQLTKLKRLTLSSIKKFANDQIIKFYYALILEKQNPYLKYFKNLYYLKIIQYRLYYENIITIVLSY